MFKLLVMILDGIYLFQYWQDKLVEGCKCFSVRPQNGSLFEILGCYGWIGRPGRLVCQVVDKIVCCGDKVQVAEWYRTC